MIKGGPKIIKDGLVLCLDAHDAKSYAGEPTTNLLGSNDNPLNGMSGVTFSKVETQSDGWIKYSMNGTFTGGTYPYICVIDSVSFTGGTAYTSRAMIKTNVESKFNYFGTTGINYVNQPKDAEGTSRSVVTEENGLNVYTVSREGFIYTSTTTQGGYLFTNPINNTTFSSSTDFVWIKNVQAEQKTYPTPWTYTSRSATDGWVDRTTNNNDGTLTNMIGTEASHYRDGQVIMPVANSYLNFDGSNDKVDCGSVTPDTGDFTIEFIYQLTGNGGRGGLFERKAGSPYNGFSLGQGGSGIWAFDVSGTSDFSNRLSLAWTYPTLNTWYHDVAVYSGGNGTAIYRNGSSVSSTSGTSQGNLSTQGTRTNFLIANRDNQTSLPCKVGLVRVYNKALTAAQILSNYNATKERFS